MTILDMLGSSGEPSSAEHGHAGGSGPGPDSLRAGELLGGRYKLVRHLGEGGMGTVWLAQDPKLGRQVAIKVLKPTFSMNSRAKARFRDEAMIGARLRHPNIVVVHDVDHDESFIVQEYVEGEDLRKILERYPLGLPLQLFLSLGIQVANAIEAAHHAGVIHRDVKPANVIVDGRQHAKLGDFGVSVIVDPNRTPRHAWVGTLYYLPPEQAWKNADARSDCYALGCLYYEMATGRLPFGGSTAEEIIEKHQFEDPQPPMAHSSALPPDVNELIMGLLNKNPTRRPAAEEVGARLAAMASPAE